jgi:hypothetical protein
MGSLVPVVKWPREGGGIAFVTIRIQKVPQTVVAEAREVKLKGVRE